MEIYLQGNLNKKGTKIKIKNSDKVSEFLLRRYKDKPLDVTIKEVELRRSLKQNRWLWGVCYQYIKRWHKQNTGEELTAEEIHAHNLVVIQGYKAEVKEVMGIEVIVFNGKRSSQWTVREFNEAKEKIQKYYSERGLNIPDPRGNSYLNQK